MRCDSDMYASLRMNCNNLDNPLTFHPVPSLGQHLNLYNNLIYDDDRSAKLVTLPSDSAVLVFADN